MADLAGGFVLAAHAVRNQASVKILEGWRYSKGPAFPLGLPLQSVTSAKVLQNEILTFPVESTPLQRR